MNEELKIMNCLTCDHYAHVAYFCMKKNDWRFPEDMGDCDKYIERTDLDEMEGTEFI